MLPRKVCKSTGFKCAVKHSKSTKWLLNGQCYVTHLCYILKQINLKRNELGKLVWDKFE